MFITCDKELNHEQIYPQREKPMVNKINKYLYCAIDGRISGDDINFKGLEDKDVQVVKHGEFSCLVSDVSRKHYPLQGEFVAAYQKTIEEAMTRYDVLPFCFNTVVDTEEYVVKNILGERSDELRKLFRKFKGKSEISLKAFWPDVQFVIRDIAENSIELRALENMTLTQGQQNAARALIGKLLEKRKKEENKQILEYVRNLGEDFMELQATSENVVLEGSFLVKKGHEKEIARKIWIFSYNFPNSKFNCTGPFPLYNFASLKINLI